MSLPVKINTDKLLAKDIMHPKFYYNTLEFLAKIICLIDPGSSNTLIKEYLFERCKLKRIDSKNIFLCTFMGTILNTTSVCEITTTIQGV